MMDIPLVVFLYTDFYILRLVLFSEFSHSHLNYMYIVNFPPQKAGFIIRPPPQRGYYIHVVECPLPSIPVMFMADHL